MVVCRGNQLLSSFRVARFSDVSYQGAPAVFLILQLMERKTSEHSEWLDREEPGEFVPEVELPEYLAIIEELQKPTFSSRSSSPGSTQADRTLAKLADSTNVEPAKRPSRRNHPWPP